MKWTERRGRNRKFKGTGAVILVIILTFVALAFVLLIQYLDLSFKMIGVDRAIAAEAIQTRAQMMESKTDLIEENALLQEKLANSSKMKVDDKTKEIVRFYIKKYFGDVAPTAEKVFTCESGLNPQAAGANSGLHAGSVDRGVAQVNDKFHKARFEKMYGIPFEIGAHDIDMNLKYAKFLYDNSGWNPWVCRKVLS